jgi:hypothetical protein
MIAAGDIAGRRMNIEHPTSNIEHRRGRGSKKKLLSQEARHSCRALLKHRERRESKVSKSKVSKSKVSKSKVSKSKVEGRRRSGLNDDSFDGPLGTKVPAV